MRVSRRQLLRQIGAGAAATVAAPALARATPPRGLSPIRLSANESAYGPSPRVLALLRDADVSAASRYPDLELEMLRGAIARRHGVGAECVVLACGSGEILRAAADMFLAPASTLLLAHPTCPAIRRHAIRKGAASAAVPLTSGWSHDLARMLSRADAAIGLVYICNPNNPTGTLTRRADLDAFVAALPRQARVLVDEAYHDYVGRAGDYASFLDRPLDDPRVIVTRSFSKAHGLAGLRVGYAVASASTARALRSTGLEDGVTAIAAIAAAAAIEDRDHLETIVRRNADDRQEFVNQANARMLRVVDSQTNFVMLNTGRPARPIVEHFLRNGIALPPPVAPLNEYIRVSLGAPSDMDEFWRVWDLTGMRM